MSDELIKTKHKGGRPKPDKEQCRLAASKYQYISEFRANEPRMYSKAYGQHWLKEFFPCRKARTSKYTKDYCRELAAKCRTRREFRDKYNTAYHMSYENGWLDDLGLPDRNTTNRMAHRVISDEEVIACARKYDTISQFRHRDASMYGIAVKRKMLSMFTWLDYNPEITNGFYDNVYVYEFPDFKVAYVGRTVNPRLRDWNHRKSGDVVYDYAVAAGVDVPNPKYIHTNITLNDGRIKEGEVMKQYIDDGWTLLNRQRAGGIGNLRRVSKKQLLDIARQYEYVSDLTKEKPGVYKALSKYGWLIECTWLRRKHGGARPGTPNAEHVSKWADYDVCKAEAMKYNSRNAFRVGSGGAFEYAWKQGWVAEWFPAKLNDPRPVGKYDKRTGVQLGTYVSVADAAAESGVCNEAIRAVCLGKNHTCGGYVYKYLDKGK